MLVAENCGRGSRVLFGLSGSGTPTHTIPDAYPSKPAALRSAASRGLFSAYTNRSLPLKPLSFDIPCSHINHSGLAGKPDKIDGQRGF